MVNMKFSKSAVLGLMIFSIMTICIMAVTTVSAQSTSATDNIYVTNTVDNNVQVLNSNTGSVVATIPGIGSKPVDMALSPDGKRAYVAVTDPATGGSTIKFIDTSSNTITNNITIPGAISNIKVSGDGMTLYVVAYGNIMYVNTAKGTIYDMWALPSAYTRFSVNPNGVDVYLCDQGLGLIDLDSSAGQVRGLGGWHGVDDTISKDGNTVYVCDKNNSTVIVTDTDLGVTPTNISTASYGAPVRVILSPDGNSVYVITDSNKVISISTQSKSIVNSWDLGSRKPLEMAASPDGQRLYVSSADNLNNRGDIAVIHLSDNSISDIFTNAGIDSIAAIQAASSSSGTATATAQPTATATPIASATATPTTITATAQPSNVPTATPKSTPASEGIFPLIPVGITAIAMLVLANRKKNQ